MERESGGAIGPMVGVRRPSYEVLGPVLDPWEGCRAGAGDLAVFVNLGSALSQLYTDYAAARVTSEELARGPRALASEVFNLAGHYRNFFWRRHGRRTTVLMYHSSARCPEKLAVSASYKEAFYAKRLSPPQGWLSAMARYVRANLSAAAELLRHVPNAHLVDTGELDPEAWPGALMAEGRVPGAALVLSSWPTDLQYALAPGCAVLLARGPHTRLVGAEGVLPHALRDVKTAGELLGDLHPEHYRYVLALSGDPELGVAGAPRTGPGRAAALVAKRVRAGGLPPGSPGLGQLLEDGGLTGEQAAAASAAWALLDHETYVSAWATPARMAFADAQMVNRSGIGELEEADRRHFRGDPLRLDMILAGEDY